MSTLISKLEKLNLDKQIEKRAKKYNLSKEEYLSKNPKVKKQYEEKKKNQLRVKLALAAGTLTVGTIAGALVLKENKEPVVENAQIEQTQEYYQKVNEVEENKNQYAEFFEMIENEDNTDKRNEMILNQTKEIIANAYNKENPNTPITTEKLQILILSESVVAKTDRLGNITYERSIGKGYDNLEENEQLVSKGKVYVFSIDGNNVATYLENGDRLEDKTIENEEPFFGSAMNMVKEYQRLKDNFKYPTTEDHTTIAENKYKEQADKLLDQKNLDKEIEQKLVEKE